MTEIFFYFCLFVFFLIFILIILFLILIFFSFYQKDGYITMTI